MAYMPEVQTENKIVGNVISCGFWEITRAYSNIKQ